MSYISFLNPLHVVGAIMYMSWFTSVSAIYLGWDLLHGISSSCSGFRFLGITLVVIGVALLAIPFLSCASAYTDPDTAVESGLGCSVCCYLPLYIVLLALAIFALAVSSEGGGKSIPGRSYKEYHVESYSKWMQHKVSDAHDWESYYKKAVVKGNMCYKFGTDYKFDSLDAFNKRDLSPIESGCCKPPEDCNFNYTSPTYWIKPETGNYTNVDCNRWDNNPYTLCFDCQSCKAAFLQDVTSHYFSTGIIWMVILSKLIFVGGFLYYVVYRSPSNGYNTLSSR